MTSMSTVTLNCLFQVKQTNVEVTGGGSLTLALCSLRFFFSMPQLSLSLFDWKVPL